MEEIELVKMLVDLGNYAWSKGWREYDFREACRLIGEGDVRIYD